MTRVSVVHASLSGHTETLACAIVDGARSVGAAVSLQAAHQVQPEDLTVADAILWGSSGYYGGVNPEMAQLFDRLGGLWLSGRLQGKVGGVFATTSTLHGGIETVLHALGYAMMHQGMIVVPNTGPFTPERIAYGCPYGASAVVPTATDLDTATGQPSAGEMRLAYEYGARVTRVARVLASTGQMQ